MKWIAYVPKSYLSWFIGVLANLPLPQPFARLLVTWFVRAYDIDASLATRPIRDFRSIGEFFTRDLRPEIRPRGEGIVSPVDGTLRSAVDVSKIGDVTLVKGRQYTVTSLLGGGPLAQSFSTGQVWNFYLSPQDAHHIFSPVDGEIIKTVHIPGKLWPVNDWAISSVDGLFVANERVVTFIKTQRGLVAVVMIGATNVGRISLSYLPLETNRAPWRRHTQRSFEHNPSLPVKRGDKIGTFKMGSSVVVVFEERLFDLRSALSLIKVTYGSSLAELCRDS